MYFNSDKAKPAVKQGRKTTGHHDSRVAITSADHDDGNGTPYYTAGDLNSSLFDNLSVEGYYWSSTEDVTLSQDAWALWMGNGFQGGPYKTSEYSGLAVHTGTVTYTAPVPEPATILLLGTGLVGLAGFGRKLLQNALFLCITGSYSRGWTLTK